MEAGDVEGEGAERLAICARRINAARIARGGEWKCGEKQECGATKDHDGLDVV